MMTTKINNKILINYFNNINHNSFQLKKYKKFQK